MNWKRIPRRGPIRVRIENTKPDSPPSPLSKLKDIAPVVTGVGTLLLSIASFSFLQIQNRQSADLAIAEVRLKALPAAAETDPAKREIGAMGVAIYGKTAAPVIRFLLSGSVTNDKMRPFGVLVVQHWMDSADARGRADVLAELFADARADSANLREGAYAALAAISPQLSPKEDEQVLALLRERFGGSTPPEANSSVARTACPILNKYDYSSVRLLLRTIAAVAPDQASQSYLALLLRSCKPDTPDTRRQLANDLTADKLLDATLRSALLARAQGSCSQ